MLSRTSPIMLTAGINKEGIIMSVFRECIANYNTMLKLSEHALVRAGAYSKVLEVVDDDRVREMMRAEVLKGKSFLDSAIDILHHAAETVDSE